MKKPPRHILEATRLTREGRLEEATAMLREGVLSLGVSPSRTANSPPAPSEKLKFPGLGQAVKALARVAPAGRPRAPALPAAADFQQRSYTCHAGTRPYGLFVPARRDVKSRPPLVVMLHGCTQTPEDFAAGTRMNEIAAELGFLVAWPGQTSAANSTRCWNWFRPDDQRRDAGEPAIIAGLTREIVEAHKVDPARIYVAGLSAGGAAAAIMGGAYPDIFSAIGVHSGLVHGSAQDLSSAMSAMRQGARSSAPKAALDRPVRTIVFHGDSDPTVAPVNADQVVAYARAGIDLSASTETGASDGGSRYTRTVYSDARGVAMVEDWRVHGGGHVWSGGSLAGSYTDPRGPDASREMVRFFLQHT